MMCRNKNSILPRLIFLFTLFSCTAFAVDSYLYWYCPNWDPSNVPTFNYLDTINASWTGNYPSPWLTRWCLSDSKSWTRCSNDPVNSTGSLALSLNGSNATQGCGPNVICHLEIYDPTDSNYDFNSVAWNVTVDAAAQPRTWTANSSSITTSSFIITQLATAITTSSSTIVQPAVANASTGTTQFTPPPSISPTPKALSTGARAGIGTGAVAVGVLLTAVAFLTYRFRRQKPRKNRNAAADVMETKASPDASGQRDQQEIQGTPVGELEPGSMGELESTWVRELEPDTRWMGELEPASPLHELGELNRKGL